MLAIPIQVNTRRILILILQKENIVRLQQADPIDLNTQDYFIPQTGNPRGIELVIAYEEDEAKLRELQDKGDVKALIDYIERGRTVYDGEIHKPRKW